MSKSIVLTINTGFSGAEVLNKPQSPEKPVIKITIPLSEPVEERQYEIIELLKPSIPLLAPTISITIPDKEDHIVVESDISQAMGSSPDEDSILDKIDTGFGPENTITLPHCPTLEYFTHLYKENYFSEFKTEKEKELARKNLDIYSTLEVNTLVTNYFESRIEELLQVLQGGELILDYVKSNSEYSILNYEIRLLSLRGVEFYPLTTANAVLVGLQKLIDVILNINNSIDKVEGDILNINEEIINLKKTSINVNTGITATPVMHYSNGKNVWVEVPIEGIYII